MRFKKGFTLAEILIVLMVIGAIATMTIPSLMRGVQESQWKTAYKKAYNSIVNLTAMERISGGLPSKKDHTGVLKMFESMNNNLAVKEYVDSGEHVIDAAGALVQTVNYSPAVTYENSSGVTINGGDDSVAYDSGSDKISPWIVTEDNLAYVITTAEGTATGGDGGDGAAAGTDCSTKQVINSQASAADALKESCVVVVVDVNGLSNGPNVVDNQVVSGVGKEGQPDVLQPLTGDRYYIYVGLDGATAGSKKYTATGRIAADMK